MTDTPKGLLDTILAHMKKQPGTHYRLTRASSERLSLKRAQGYENVHKDDPEIKGTILARNANADGAIQIGNLIVQKVPEERAKELRKEVDDRTRAREEHIKRKYLEGGEAIQRKMGTHHKDIKFIAESKEE